MEFGSLLESLYEASGGAEAGTMPLMATHVDDAYAYAKDQLMRKQKEDIDELLPEFKHHYQIAQHQATSGRLERKDMPVISSRDVRMFQQRLVSGTLDIKPPYSDLTNPRNPFPKGLTGKEADLFVKKGLPAYDKGPERDDKVSAKITKVRVGALRPIQHQIYADNAIDRMAKDGVKSAEKFIFTQSNFITSIDNYIIDGHHRYLTGLLINPMGKVSCLQIDLPISILLPLAVAYSDAIGNKRNQ